MLNTISWTDFFTTLAALVVIYYSGAVLYCYHQEILHLIKGKTRTGNPSTTPPRNTNPLIGPTRATLPAPVATDIYSEELHIAPQEPEDSIDVLDPLAEKQHQARTDILGQVESLAQVTIHTPVIELETLFRTLLANYPELKETPLQTQVTQSITTTLQQHGHTISDADVQSWWPT